MPGPLVETKLRIPRPRHGLVDRRRVTARLERAVSARLTLVSAPPGFGKTTLLAQWARDRRDEGWVVAWLSLDAGDADPARFWRYVLGSLDAAAREAGQALDLEGAVAADGGIDVGALINTLDGIRVEVAIVLDDLHLIESATIHDALAAFLDRAPDHVHLAVTTRADPPLPLARLRARGELAEVRAADLRFDRDEADAFLRDAMGLDLSAEQVSALEARTEGWVAALQLAGLSMADREDVGPFIDRFAGNDRFVVDYLADEVLARQPEAIRAFLLRTSILDRLAGPLCDALTGRDDGRAVLDRLDRANLFLVPLDDDRRWFRYHHLFADVLRARLFDEDPGLVPELHGTASRWWEAQGELAEAIDHALAAADHGRAADLIEVAAHDLRSQRQERTLRAWLDRLPDEVFDRRPMLAIVHGAALLSTGATAGVAARLDAAARWVAAANDDEARAAAVADGMIVHRVDALPHLPSALALHRAGLARMAGDDDATIAHARAALEAAGEDQPLERGGAAGVLALAAWSRGDLDTAAEGWSEAIRNLERAGHHGDVLGCTIGLADIRMAQGRLHEAQRTYEDALRRAERVSPRPRGIADMHVGLCELHHEWGDLSAARQHLQAGEDPADGLPQHPYRWRVASALLQQADGRPEAAVELLDEAERRYEADFFPAVRPIAAIRARLWLAQGRVADAEHWARASGVVADEPVSYLREYELLTLARLRLAQGRAGDAASIAEATGLLERIAAGADAGGRRRAHLESLVLLAAALADGGRPSEARATLERTLHLAEPEGFVRAFLDAGEPVRRLLEEAARRGSDSPYARRVLEAAGDHPATRPAQPGPIEPLSDRELEVLRLLASDLDGPAIARELYVSLNTMRTHTKNIFAKLGVNSRREAVRRAAELGLVPRRGG